MAQWEAVQVKTFTKWVNSHLNKRAIAVDNVRTAFQDGVNLIHLLEIISDETLPRKNLNPKMKIHKVENVGWALKFIAEHNVKLASIGPNEIVDGDVKLTLGMLWTIILRFAIAGLSEEGMSAKQGLLLWCQRKTEPYNNVDVKDFSPSFHDGLAFCALIHRHRPDLIDYEKLTSEDKLGNLNLAFDVALRHLGVPRILDAEDIANMPRPDERSVMTYVAQLYNVFASMDKVEHAGRRLGKFVNFSRQIDEMQQEYEQRTKALNDQVNAKARHFGDQPHGEDYASVKAEIAELRQYKTSARREWVVEQANLATLLGNIQAKLQSLKRPLYVPPAGLSVRDVELNFEALSGAERTRRSALNQKLRAILDALRHDFANVANPFYDHLQAIRSALHSTATDLAEQLALFVAKTEELKSLAPQLGPIEEAEKRAHAANIEDNEYSDHTYEDLAFEYEQLSAVFSKKVSFIESQIAADQSSGVSAEQLQEFKESFNHFDIDGDRKLSKLEFKSCMSSLGIVNVDFGQGGDKAFEEIFQRVSNKGAEVNFDQFVDYMVSITADAASLVQLQDAFSSVTGNKAFITENDMRVAQLPEDQVQYLLSVLPPTQGGYDFKAWLSAQFGVAQ